MSSTTRKIGNAQVPPIGFGAMGISAFYGKVESDEERFKILDAALEGGSTHWDTASVYGDSEVLLGKWFKRTGKRDQIFLATKFGFSQDGIRGDPEFVKSEFEKSKSKLGVDHVDLYYLHRPAPNTPIEVTVGAMAELVKEGKVKYLGLSEVSANDLRRAHAVHPIAALQVEYSPFVLAIEDEKLGLLKAARELGVTIVAYSPLARGLITGQYKSTDDFAADDFRRTVPKYAAENFPRILEVVDQLTEIGKKHNATAGQVTLSWILAQGEDFVVIPGTKKIKYLKENLGAEKVKLSSEEISAVRKIAEAAEIPGERYSDHGMSVMHFDTPALSTYKA